MATPEGKIILITGGSRSGKSEFAEKLAWSLGSSCAYIATAQILDEEMRRRVAAHRQRRQGGFWTDYEAPFAAHELMRSVSREDSILFDCVTIYITNLLYNQPAPDDKKGLMEKEIGLLLSAARHSGKHVLFVTNEVGSGIVPFEPATREFRDLAGQANQILAAAADEVYLVVSGLAIEIKSLSIKFD